MIKFATIGTSTITDRFIHNLGKSSDAEVEAVYSRTAEKARKYASENKIKKHYSNLQQIAEDKEIDAVYIASPNSLHFEQANYLMEQGKHILCEKTLASNKAEVLHMFQTAKNNKVLLMEAMRTVHDDAFLQIKDALSKLGIIRKATLEFCQYSSRYDLLKEGKEVNIFRLDLSAGALMDIGVYCVHPMVALFGKPNEVTSIPVMVDGQIDGAGSILAKYDQMIAELSYSKITDSNNYSQIQGENGTMYIAEIQNPKRAFIVYRDGSREEIQLIQCSDNFIYEIQDFILAIEQGKEIQYYSKLSIDVIDVMDQVRKQMGIIFPADRKVIINSVC